jgi:transcriptional regulator of met regulon
MSREHQPPLLDERTQRAVNELKATILQHYPTAAFELSYGQDHPENIHLNTVVDVDDPFDVLDKVIDRVVDLQVDEGIPLHVIPMRTPERVRAELETQRQLLTRRRRTIPLFSRLP